VSRVSRLQWLFSIVLLLLFTACLRRAGRNDQCQWPNEPERLLDLHNAADQAHLRDDARFAEEVAIRYADRFRRTDGFTQGHRRLMECTGTLFGRVGVLHGVSPEAVARAAFERNRMADSALVFVPVGLSFLLFSYGLCGRIFARTDSIVSAAVTAFLMSIPVSGCGVLIGELWAIAVETLLIGNGHLSFRTGRIPWLNERVYLFVIGLGLFWIIAGVRY
jgi:hypothetical protein